MVWAHDLAIRVRVGALGNFEQGCEASYHMIVVIWLGYLFQPYRCLCSYDDQPKEEPVKTRALCQDPL